MFEKYYLAYGSNLNLIQMYYRCRYARPIGTCTLENYRLMYKGFRDQSAFLTIEEKKGSYVPLGLFKVTHSDIASLDKYEGYPDFYSKQYLPIMFDGKRIQALIYIMNEEYDYHIPSIEYVATCQKGYENFGFDQKVLRKAFIDTADHIAKKQD